MIKLIKRLYKKWSDWENDEVLISLGVNYIKTNNYTIQLFILIIILIMLIIQYYDYIALH
jgi:hypothetical protein